MTVNLVVGSVFANDYRVVRPLSVGGMGSLFVVEQISTGKLRALKLMHRELVADPMWRQRFEQEARVGSRIASEHVIEVQAAGVDAQTELPYLVMELLEGEDLSSRLKRGAVPLAEAIDIFEQIAHALGAAHDAGVVHRDLKPENIFLAKARRTGGSRIVKVLDFGIAKVMDDQRRTTGAFGTPLWLAPEQTRPGHMTPAVDVWSLALVVFATLTGHVFWRAGDNPDASLQSLIDEILNAPIPTASSRAREFALELPNGIDAWFATALMRDPNARYPNVRVAFTALAPILSARSAPEPVVEAKPKSGGKGVMIALVIMALLLVLAISGAVALFVMREKPMASAAPLAAAATSASADPTTTMVSATAEVPSADTSAIPNANTTKANTTHTNTTAASANAPPLGTHAVVLAATDDIDLRTDAMKQVNDTLSNQIDTCLATHPKHALQGNVTLIAHVTADGAVTTVSSAVEVHQAVQCMIDRVKAAKFVSRKKASDLVVNVTWR